MLQIDYLSPFRELAQVDLSFRSFFFVFNLFFIEVQLRMLSWSTAFRRTLLREWKLSRDHEPFLSGPGMSSWASSLPTLLTFLFLYIYPFLILHIIVQISISPVIILELLIRFLLKLWARSVMVPNSVCVSKISCDYLCPKINVTKYYFKFHAF